MGTLAGAKGRPGSAEGQSGGAEGQSNCRILRMGTNLAGAGECKKVTAGQ